MKTKTLRLLTIILVLLMLVTVPACSKKDDKDNDIKQEVDKVIEEEEKDVEVEVEVEIDPFIAIVNDLKLDGGMDYVYEQVGIKAGTCLSNTMINNEKYSQILLDNFSSITLENEMKPDVLLNREASTEEGDIVVLFPQSTTVLLDWAKENALSAHGHLLVWFTQTPDWIFYEDFDISKELVDRDTCLNRMESYIRGTFEQLEELGYSEMFTSYDVVNEALEDDGTLKDCHWLDIIGEDYIWHAFNFAKQYAPDNIKLYYNDYNEQFKKDYIIDLVKSLVGEDGNYLIDGIGCQAHLYTYDSVNRYVETLEAFSETGLDIRITALDVSLGTWQKAIGASDDNLRMQGDYYYRLISTIVGENMRGNTNVSSITFWGFADNLSWKPDRHPLFFDEDMNPKYSYYGAKLDKNNAGY